MISHRRAETVEEMLLRKAWQELSVVEGIDRLKFLAYLKQLRNLVSRVFNLS
jgi:hypothetical protein